MSFEVRSAEFLLDGVEQTSRIFRDAETALRHVYAHVLNGDEGWSEVLGIDLPLGDCQIGEPETVSLYEAYARAIERVLHEEAEIRLHLLHTRARTERGPWRDETNIVSLDAIFVGLSGGAVQTAYRPCRHRGRAPFQRFIGTLLAAEIKANRGEYENTKAGVQERRHTIPACRSSWRLDRWSYPRWAAEWRRLRGSRP